MKYASTKVLRFEKTGLLDDLSIRELPIPTPAPGEVPMRVKAAAVNPSDAWSDWLREFPIQEFYAGERSNSLSVGRRSIAFPAFCCASRRSYRL